MFLVFLQKILAKKFGDCKRRRGDRKIEGKKCKKDIDKEAAGWYYVRVAFSNHSLTTKKVLIQSKKALDTMQTRW